MLFHMFLLCACAGQVHPVVSASQPTPTARVVTPSDSPTSQPAPTITNIPPGPRPPSRIALPSEALRDADLVQALRGGGYVIYILTAGSDGSQSDKENQVPETCGNQSILSAEGQIDARAKGASFVALGIPAGQVLHDGSCIGHETAMLAFGRGESWVTPNGFSVTLRGEQIAILRELLSTAPRSGTNTVLVGPGPELTDVTGARFEAGETVIYKPLGKTGYSFLTRIPPTAWEQFEHSETDLVPVEPCMSDGVQVEQVGPSFAPTGQPESGIDQTNEQVQICRPGPAPTAVENVLLPDLVTLPPTELRILVNAEQKLLRFTNSIMNIGPGKIELWGASNPETGKITVTQHIYTAEDFAEEMVVGEFFFHPEHDHWHLGDFARYEVWSLGPEGGLDTLVALGNKISYCLRDDARADVPGAARRQTYTSCEQERQGISVGWIDIYRYHLDGQSIDISSLEDGVYALRSIVNPENNLQEGNSTNNSAILYFEIEGRHISIVEAPDSANRLFDGQN